MLEPEDDVGLAAAYQKRLSEELWEGRGSLLPDHPRQHGGPRRPLRRLVVRAERRRTVVPSAA